MAVFETVATNAVQHERGRNDVRAKTRNYPIKSYD